MKRVRRRAKPKVARLPPQQGVRQMPTPRQVLSGSKRNAVAGARFLGKTDAAAQIHVTVVLRRKNEIHRDQLHQHALLRPHERPSVDDATLAEQYGPAMKPSRLSEPSLSPAIPPPA